jgi:hypothetical protein
MWFTRKARRDDNGEGGTARAWPAERDDILAELAAAKAQLARIRGLVASNEDDDILAAVQLMVTERHYYNRVVGASSELLEIREGELASARAQLDLLPGVQKTAIAETKRANVAAHERDAARAEVARLERALRLTPGMSRRPATSQLTASPTEAPPYAPCWRRWLGAV